MQAMEWADYRLLNDPCYLLLSKELYDMEVDLGKWVTDALHWSRRFEYPWVFIKLQPFTKDDIVLDAGVGYSVFHLLILRIVREVYSVDVDADAVNWLNKVTAEKGFNAFATLGDLTNMTFPANYFNKTICISTLEHIPKQKVVDGIEELIRVTKLGGKIAITMDIALEETDKQTDINDLKDIATKYCLMIPDFPTHTVVFKTAPYDFPFTIACILLEK